MSKVTVEKKRYVRSTLAQGKSPVCVGKKGASKDAFGEIENQLKRQEMGLG